MERLSFFKDRGNNAIIRTPSKFLIGLVFGLLNCQWALNTYLSITSLNKLEKTIQNAPLTPHTGTLSFIPFHPERAILCDDLTQVTAPGHRLERSVSQFRTIPPTKEPVLFPMIAEPESFKNKPSSQLNLWSKSFVPTVLKDGLWSVFCQDIGMEYFGLRNDLIQIPSGPESGRWIPIAKNKIFIGSDPDQPKDGQYVITYHAYVLPKIILLGTPDSSGLIKVQRIFKDDRKQPHPQQQLLAQIDRIKNSVLSLNMMIATAWLLIAFRETNPPKSSYDFFKKMAQYCQYDLIFSPLVLLIQPTLLNASIFGLIFCSYISFKFFLRRSLILLEQDRINLYG